MNSLLISGARILDPASGFDGPGHLGLRDGRIDYFSGDAPGAKYEAQLDASGLWLTPGLIDLSARLREPGQRHKASIKSELVAARASGVTALCVPPDTDPVIDNPSVVDWLNQRVDQLHSADVHLLGALTVGLNGESLAELGALAHAGCVGAMQLRTPLHNLQLARRALEYAANFSMTVHVQPCEASLADGGCAHEGPVATSLGLPGIPVAAETVAIAQWLELAQQTGAAIHFCRLSSGRGAQMLAAAKAAGLSVSADVAIHQLYLTEADLQGFNTSAHIQPPARSEADRQALREAVATGVISAICSDHQPHDVDAKTNPLPMTEAGISSLESWLPLSLALAEEGLMSPLEVISRMTTWPALILGAGGGSLAVGEYANLALIDADEQWTLIPEAMLSRGHNTPFAGWTMRGRVQQTYYRGRQVFVR